MNSDPRPQPGGAPASGEPMQQLPPGLSPNGHSPTARLIEALPQMLAQAMASVLMQVPVRTVGQQQRACATCLVRRLTWDAAHEADVAQAQEKAAQAAGQPELAGLDWTAFLPPDLRPGAGEQAVPEVRLAVTSVQGTDLCAADLPGLPKAGKKAFLIAHQPLTPGLLAEIMQGQPA